MLGKTSKYLGALVLMLCCCLGLQAQSPMDGDNKKGQEETITPVRVSPEVSESFGNDPVGKPDNGMQGNVTPDRVGEEVSVSEGNAPAGPPEPSQPVKGTPVPAVNAIPAKAPE